MKKRYTVYYQIVGVDNKGGDYKSPVKYKTKAKAIRKGLGLRKQLAECWIQRRFIDRYTGLLIGFPLFMYQPSDNEIFNDIIQRTCQFLADTDQEIEDTDPHPWLSSPIKTIMQNFAIETVDPEPFIEDT